MSAISFSTYTSCQYFQIRSVQRSSMQQCLVLKMSCQCDKADTVYISVCMCVCTNNRRGCLVDGIGPVTSTTSLLTWPRSCINLRPPTLMLFARDTNTRGWLWVRIMSCTRTCKTAEGRTFMCCTNMNATRETTTHQTLHRERPGGCLAWEQ